MTHTVSRAAESITAARSTCVSTFYNKISNQQIRNVDLFGGVLNFTKYSVPNILYL